MNGEHKNTVVNIHSNYQQRYPLEDDEMRGGDPGPEHQTGPGDAGRRRLRILCLGRNQTNTKQNLAQNEKQVRVARGGKK
jgi:hypothetical protein